MSASSGTETGKDTSIGTYVYGITAADHPALPSFAEELRGVGDPPCSVRVLTAGALAAIVSDAPEKLRPKRRDLLAHQQRLQIVLDQRLDRPPTAPDFVRVAHPDQPHGRHHDQD